MTTAIPAADTGLPKPMTDRERAELRSKILSLPEEAQQALGVIVASLLILGRRAK